MRRAALVHVDAGVRHAAQDRAGGAGVIEMDVRQQDVPHLVEAGAEAGQPLFESGQTRRRAGVDDHQAIGGAKDRRRDHARTAPEVQVDAGAHSWNERVRSCEA